MNSDVSSPTSFPEKENFLLVQLHEGSREAFTLLYNYYQPRLLLYLGPFTYHEQSLAEEVIQEVFIRLWMKRKELLHVKAVEFYLQRMAKNLLLDIVRAGRIKKKHENRSIVGQDDWIEETESEYQFREYYRLTREALALLPERRRYLFQLSTVEGCSLDEIAARTHLSKAVVKKQLSLANQFLRKHLQEKGGFPVQAGVLLLCSLLVTIK